MVEPNIHTKILLQFWSSSFSLYPFRKNVWRHKILDVGCISGLVQSEQDGLTHHIGEAEEMLTVAMQLFTRMGGHL